MIDCVTFRRRLLENPQQDTRAMARHEASCPTCAAYAQQVRSTELQLAKLFDVDVPPELSERIQLAVSFERSPSQRRRRPLWLATAASLLLAVFIGVLWLHERQPIERPLQVTLSESVLHHINDEIHVLRQPGPVGPYKVERVFSRFGAAVTGPIGPVSFAAECKMRNKTGVHLVIPGEMGAITVMFMPGEMTDHQEVIVTERFTGKILPTSWGSIAIVGEKGEHLDLLARRLQETVEWPARVSGLTNGDASAAS